MSAPALRTRWRAARGLGAFENERRIRVSGTKELSEAQLFHGSLAGDEAGDSAALILALAARTARQRGFGDFYQHVLVASGAGDLAFDHGLKAWDVAPLFVLLNRVQVPFTDENLRTTLLGVGVAYTSGALPFAIWNLRGYIDTLPRELEESAMVDGATPHRAFVDVVLPLIMPAIAITVLFGFMAAWTEFVLAWTFLTDPDRFTLALM